MSRSNLQCVAAAVFIWLVWSMDSQGQGARQAANKESSTSRVQASPLRKLEGDWELVAFRRFGSEIKYNRGPDAKVNNRTVEEGFVILPVYLDVQMMGVAYVMFKLQDAANDGFPHAVARIDLVNQDDEGLARMMRGIYKFDGNFLMICFNPTGGKFRPRTFATGPGLDQELVILQRRKSRSTNAKAGP
jgi:uncharacterized protein (TIGR03067 family)